VSLKYFCILFVRLCPVTEPLSTRHMSQLLTEIEPPLHCLWNNKVPIILQTVAEFYFYALEDSRLFDFRHLTPQRLRHSADGKLAPPVRPSPTVEASTLSLCHICAVGDFARSRHSSLMSLMYRL